MSTQKKLLQNTAWIIGCKIIQSVLALVVTMLTARYLGPTNYGIISYAASLVAFVIPVMQLGLRSTLVQEFVESPEKEGEIIGSSLVMNIISSVVCIIAVTAFSTVIDPGEKETILVCALYSFSLFFGAIEMIQYWFQSKLLSKYTSVIMLISYVVVSAYKIFLLVSGKSVYWYAVSYSIDYAFIGLSLFCVYKKLGGQKLSISFTRMKAMFDKSKYYIISGLMVTIFSNTDRVMLKMISGETVTGFYSASVACVSMTGFIFGALIDSFRPIIFTSKKKDEKVFEKNLSILYCVVFYLGLLQGTAFTLLADPIIRILYGAEYLPSISILQIVVWYYGFSYMGSVRNIWMLAENKQKYLWMINLSGALMNVCLNACFIPIWGACGAALGSVLTQIFTNFLIGFIIKPIKENNKILLKGLNPLLLLKMIKKLKRIV